MPPRHRNILACAVFLSVGLLLLACGTAVVGQTIVQVPRKAVLEGRQGVVVTRVITTPAPASNEDLAENVFLPPDRRTLQRFFQAKELLAKGRYGEAVQNLGAILDGPEDYFFQPQQEQPIHRSLKAEAQRLIGQMPREGRELYELQYGARAKHLLEEAIAAGDVQRLAEVSRRFFHTRAGYEATFLLGLYHLDHGRPLSGALILQRLMDSPVASDQFEPALSLAMATGWLQAGVPEKAREALLALRERRPQMTWEIGAEKFALFNDNSAALDWLKKLVGRQQSSESAEADRWLMFRGNPQRNAISSGSAPLLNLCWRVPATDDPLIEEALEQNRRGSLERGVPALCGLYPLLVDDVLLMRTYKNLLAVDFNTGKRLWEVPTDDSPENSAAAGDVDMNPQSFFLAALLSQRVWNDATFGTLSSDGKLVFGIEDAGSAVGMRSIAVGARRVISFNNSPMGAAYNRLAAYDIHSGKLIWQAGGGPNEPGVRIPEAFFLGPPLPLMGNLYVLADMKGEIRLLALEAANGNLLWSQQLAVVERSIQQDLQRRLMGISPSYADGILICPTSSGALVAVELATRSLLWGYRYGRDNPADNAQTILVTPLGELRQMPNQVLDGSVCVAEGRIVATPMDSDSLHCLNLIDGELRWKHKLKDEIYVACVHQDKAILVGRHQVQAIRLSDGKPAWDGRVVALPEGAMPSGRGFYAGDRYFVPLDSAEVAAIDLSAGKLDHLCTSRKGQAPGNLVCYKGRVISQSPDGVDAFYQIDAALNQAQRRLAANPADADGLCLQGEIFLDAGKRAEAIDCFRRAYAANADPHSRELLRETLLDGLREEFARYREHSTEVAQLLEDPSQRTTYLRLMIAGLQHSGDLPAAFEHWQKLFDLEIDQLHLETVSKSLAVRCDRWMQAQLDCLRREAKGEIAEKIDEGIRSRYQTAATVKSVEALQRFLDYFGNQPIAAEARAELFRKLIQSRRLLEAEMTLWGGASLSDPAAHASALAEIAEMFRAAGLKQPAASTYSWLRQRFGNVVCREGKTAAELVQALPGDDAIRLLLDEKTSWPVGQVDVATNSSKTNLMNTYGNFAIKIQGLPGPYFANVNLTFDQNRRLLLCFDALGNKLWQIILIQDQAQRQQYLQYNPATTHVQAIGHLLLLSISGRKFAIDTLGADEKNPPKILWSESMMDKTGDLAGVDPLFLLKGQLGGILQMRMMQTYNQNNEQELATAGYICVQHSRNLVALDPLNGSTLWARQDIPPESTLFGDEEYVFVLPPDKTEALVLRALDGELLGARKIPRTEVDLEQAVRK